MKVCTLIITFLFFLNLSLLVYSTSSTWNIERLKYASNFITSETSVPQRKQVIIKKQKSKVSSENPPFNFKSQIVLSSASSVRNLDTDLTKSGKRKKHCTTNTFDYKVKDSNKKHKQALSLGSTVTGLIRAQEKELKRVISSKVFILPCSTYSYNRQIARDPNYELERLCHIQKRTHQDQRSIKNVELDCKEVAKKISETMRQKMLSTGYVSEGEYEELSDEDDDLSEDDDLVDESSIPKETISQIHSYPKMTYQTLQQKQKGYGGYHSDY